MLLLTSAVGKSNWFRYLCLPHSGRRETLRISGRAWNTAEDEAVLPYGDVARSLQDLLLEKALAECKSLPFEGDILVQYGGALAKKTNPSLTAIVDLTNQIEVKDSRNLGLFESLKLFGRLRAHSI